MKQQLVIGLGTGRCGTRSFTHLLNEQQDVFAIHEGKFSLWQLDNSKALAFIDDLVEKSTVPILSDVAFYWLHYVDVVLEKYPTAKFVCLKRNKEAVINSYMRNNMLPLCFKTIFSEFKDAKVVRLSQCVNPKDLEDMDEGTREWIDTYWEVPFIDDMSFVMNNRDTGQQNRLQYLDKFYDEYYEKAEKWQDKYTDNFTIIGMDDLLNTDEGKSKIFNFIGIVPNAAIQ